MADKFRSAALLALGEYYDRESAEEAIRMAFDWCHTERGYFNNGALSYYRELTLGMFDLFEPCGICKKHYTKETLQFHVPEHLIRVHG